MVIYSVIFLSGKQIDTVPRVSVHILLHIVDIFNVIYVTSPIATAKVSVRHVDSKMVFFDLWQYQ
jgi:hypothetical protein